MTIASETSRVNLVGDGVNDTFTFTFEIYVKTDLLVYVDNVLQAVDVNYTVADEGLENPDGGTIVFGAEYIPVLDAVVSIILNLPCTQLIDYVEADKFPAETHERGLDRLVKIAQQLKERIARQPALLESSQYSDLTLPDPVASKLLAWKDDLSGIKNVEVESEGDLLVTDFIKTLLDDEDATAALATLGLIVTDFIKTLLDDGDADIALATLSLTATKEEINTVCDPDNKFHSPLSIPHTAFVPAADTYDWESHEHCLKNRTTLEAQTFCAPVILPDGVSINKFTLYGYRTAAPSILSLTLLRYDRAGGSATMGNTIAGWSDGYGSAYTYEISYHTIDNVNYSYVLMLIIDPDASVDDVQFTGAKIEFTY